ncbi:MAG: hypothetical protein JXO22_15855, partial [Phycisphaerae bacterium]|nr:hypothetical protein [Phycisphaerae bacterium]
LEYHLQVPREYFDAGRITFLSHNVYASFPQQVEIHYLLLMHLVGDAHAAAIPAQLFHGLMGVLLMLAMAAWSRPGWPRIATVVTTGTVPWLAYVGCLAYVELGMLFFAAVACGVLLDHLGNARYALGWRALLAAGLCAGLAGGCKYTALVIVALGLGLAYLFVSVATERQLWQRLLPYAIGVFAAVCPWLIRNAVFTGNPVLPFACNVFPTTQWTADQAAQWDRGHHLPPESAGLVGRLGIGWHELFESHMFGSALFVLALGGFLARRDRRAWLLLVWAVLIGGVWAAMTHMPGRFAMPLVVPLGLLAGGLLEWNPRGQSLFDTATTEPPRLLRVPVLLVVVIGALLNGSFLWGMLQREQRVGKDQVPFEAYVDATQTLVQGHPVNTLTPPDAYVWLVGDARGFYITRKIHYTVVFSRDPWLLFAATGATPVECVDWLRTRNVTHVVFSWAEIERLRGTYGFADVVMPEWAAELKAAGLEQVDQIVLGDGKIVSETLAVTPR